MAGHIEIRDGSWADSELLLALFDEAVSWLVARGQTGQWGTEPFSEQPARARQVRELARRGGLRIAELDGQPVGALAVGVAPGYAPSIEQRELYIVLLLTSRRHAGKRIGTHLIQRAVQEARLARCEVLRVDCWAGAPSLMRWYEKQGFERTERFDVNGWTGQVLGMLLG